MYFFFRQIFMRLVLDLEALLGLERVVKVSIPFSKRGESDLYNEGLVSGKTFGCLSVYDRQSKEKFLIFIFL